MPLYQITQFQNIPTRPKRLGKKGPTTVHIPKFPILPSVGGFPLEKVAGLQ